MSLEDQEHQRQLHTLGATQTKSSYKATYPKAATPADEPVIPDPSIFAFTAKDSSPSGMSLSPPSRGHDTDILRLPTVAECATHLELLEVFYVLQQSILKSPSIDATFGIVEKPEVKRGVRGDQKKLKDETFWNRRQVKWTRFVDLAAVRFLVWRDFMCKAHRGHGAKGESSEGEARRYWLPPLDVLMVWHAFLLNPRLFRLHCADTPLVKLQFPWKAVHTVINNSTWTFTLPMLGAAAFDSTTGLNADLFEELAAWKEGHKDGAEELVQAMEVLKLDEAEKKPPAIPEWVCGLKHDDQIRRHFEVFHKVDIDLAIQLRDAVVRQASFVDKMNRHLWIRSPAVGGTLARAIDRYAKFLRLMKLYPKIMLVPTLDIDLVWHTHQCSPGMYAPATRHYTGRFINHDDTVLKGKLDTGFGETRNLFRVRFGLEYRACGCWDCEALLDALEKVSRDGGEEEDMEAVVAEVQGDVAYFRAVEMARRKKEILPVRG